MSMKFVKFGIYKIRKYVYTDDFVPLIDVIRSGEQNVAAYHFSHNAADRPKINVLLVSHAKDDFWRTVITSHDVRCHPENEIHIAFSHLPLILCRCDNQSI